MTNNPLLQKYEELYGKKEEPKVIKAKNPKTSLTTYDPHDLSVSFHQVAGQLQTGKAQVTSMNMEMGEFTCKTITFEVAVYE
jgi:hypothetical protein